MRYIILVALLVINSSHAASPSNIEYLTIAGRTYTDLRGLKILVCSTTTSDINFVTSCIDETNAFYLVPVGLQYRIFGVRVTSNGAFTRNSVEIGYHTAPRLNETKIGVCTGASAGCGGVNYSFIVYPQTSQVAAAEYNLESNGPIIPAGNYPWVSSLQPIRTTVVLYGIEETP